MLELVAREPVPPSFRHLFWEVDAGAIDLGEHADYVMERVMSRGGWDAMRWLRTTYSRPTIADFLTRKGTRLTPRDRAYWALIAGVREAQVPGGGRPEWAG